MPEGIPLPEDVRDQCSQPDFEDFSPLKHASAQASVEIIEIFDVRECDTTLEAAPTILNRRFLATFVGGKQHAKRVDIGAQSVVPNRAEELETAWAVIYAEAT